MYKAVIFDMDGVLVDSQPFHFDADMFTLRECGFPAELANVKGYAGMASIERWERYRQDYGLQVSVEKLIKSHDKIKKELLKTLELEAADGVKELLDMLKARGLKLAVESSSKYDFIYLILDMIGVRAYFDVVLSGEQMSRSKPEPDIFLATAGQLNTPPEECVVIEDSENGVLAACAANMKCIGYVNKSSGEQDLSKADMRISSFFELIYDGSWLD